MSKLSYEEKINLYKDKRTECLFGVYHVSIR